MRISWGSLRVATVAPVFLIVVISTVIVQRAAQGTHVRELLNTPAKKFATVALQLDASLPAINLERIRDQSLFHESRSFYVPPPPSPVPSAPPRPNYHLSGTFIIPRKPAVALLARVESGEQRKVIAGDDLDGWRVQAVERSLVVLQFDDLRIEIGRDSQPSASGLIRAPLVRTDAGISSQPSIRTLGNGGVPRAVTRRVSAASSPQIAVEKRLYRPPPQ